MKYQLNTTERFQILNEPLSVSEAQLTAWATDENCKDKDIAAKALTARPAILAAKLALLSGNPFNPRVDVSADARHIVKHLWIIAVGLPALVGMIWAVIYALNQ